MACIYVAFLFRVTRQVIGVGMKAARSLVKRGACHAAEGAGRRGLREPAEFHKLAVGVEGLALHALVHPLRMCWNSSWVRS